MNYETSATKRSDSEAVQEDVQVQPVSFTPTIRYSHNENYTKLRGELEYSQIDERCKLRYISVGEEKFDDYGGSVILRETAKLSGFERGDFVEIHGRLLSGPQGDLGYARSYEVFNIQPIR